MSNNAGGIYNPSASDSGPWWVKVLYQIGIVSFCFGLLLWWLITKVDAKLETIQEDLKGHKSDSQYSVKSNERQIQELTEIKLILSRMCANDAKTTDERNRCFGVDK